MLKQDAIDEERMDVAQRKCYSAECKARVALEALNGQKTVHELASTYGVHPTQIAHWKHRLHKERPAIVSARRVKREDEPEALQAQLYHSELTPCGRNTKC
jgi:transposase-like protein